MTKNLLFLAVLSSFSFGIYACTTQQNLGGDPTNGPDAASSTSTSPDGSDLTPDSSAPSDAATPNDDAAETSPGDVAAELAAARALCASAAQGTVDPYKYRKQLGDRAAGRWLFCSANDDPQSPTKMHGGIEMTAAGKWWFLQINGNAIVRETGAENSGDWYVNYGGTGDPPPNDLTQVIDNTFYLAVATGTFAGTVAFETGPRRFIYSPNVTWTAVIIGP